MCSAEAERQWELLLALCWVCQLTPTSMRLVSDNYPPAHLEKESPAIQTFVPEMLCLRHQYSLRLAFRLWAIGS